MKSTVFRLTSLHGAVLVLSALIAAFLWGPMGSLSAFVGAFSFSLPVVLFSLLVLRASKEDQGRFWGRFMAAELLKWVSSAVLLASAFILGYFSAQPLLAGFFLSVLVQVFFPIFVHRGSES